MRPTHLLLAAAGTGALVLASIGFMGGRTKPVESNPQPDRRVTRVMAPDPESPEPLAPPDPGRIEAAVEKGLQYLRRTQDRTTGAWIQNVGYKYNSDYVMTDRGVAHVGVTSLALMAFLSGGHLPGRGEHGSVVERGTDYVLQVVDPQWGYVSANGTRMYSHAFASLFLAEIYGMTHRDDVKEKLQLAVDLTVKSQNQHGSWRYHPNSPESDMSITVCQIMALRAARNIGIRVPKSTIDRAFDYVDRSAYKNRGSEEYGGFKYQEKDRSRTSVPLTAAGVATILHSGIYEGELIRAGIHFLKNEIPVFNRMHGGRDGHYFFWYGHYYAAQVFFLAGDGDPELWNWYWNRMSRELLEAQEADGSWPNSAGPGTAFSTAVACIILQIPNQFLPIFHR